MWFWLHLKVKLCDNILKINSTGYPILSFNVTSDIIELLINCRRAISIFNMVHSFCKIPHKNRKPPVFTFISWRKFPNSWTLYSLCYAKKSVKSHFCTCTITLLCQWSHGALRNTIQADTEHSLVSGCGTEYIHFYCYWFMCWMWRKKEKIKNRRWAKVNNG